MNNKTALARITAGIFATVLPVAAFAQSTTWLSTSDNNWSTPANWSNGVPGAPGAQAHFYNNTAPLGGRAFQVDAPVTLGEWLIGGNNLARQTFSFAGSAITFDNNSALATLSVSGYNTLSIGNAINLAGDLAVNLIVNTDLGTSNGVLLNLNGPVALSGKNLAFTITDAAGIATVNGDITGSGTVTMNGMGTLVMNGGNSAFTDFTTASGKTRVNGDLTIGAADAGKNKLGAGNVSISNLGNSVLRETSVIAASTAAGQSVTLAGSGTLTLQDSGNLTIRETAPAHAYAFNLTGGHLRAAGANKGVLILQGADLVLGTGATLVNSPDITFDNGAANNSQTITGAAPATAFGNVTKTGAATLTFANTGLFNAASLLVAGGTVALTAAPTLSLTGALTLAGGDLSFGAPSQYSGALALDSRNTIWLRGNDQSFSSLAIAAGNHATLDLGADTVTANLGAVTLASTNSLLKITGWRDGASVINATSVSNPANVWFHGYNKGANFSGGVLAPNAGFLDSTWTGGAGNLNWFVAANWLGGDEYNIPDAPGAIARFTTQYGDLSGKTISLQNRSATIGQLYMPAHDRPTIGSGILIFDSGVPGAPATIHGTANTINISATTRLDSDLEINENLRVRNLQRVTGAGKIILSNTLARLSLANASAAASTFTGGIDISNNAYLYFYSAAGAGATPGSWAGTGTITIKSTGGRIYGDNEASSTAARYMARITNPIALENLARLYTYAMYYDYNGNVNLTGTNWINIANSTQSSNYANHSVVFGSGFNFTGTGALIIEGSYGVQMLSGNNTFSGGFIKSTSGGELRVTAGANNIVLGSHSPGNNYIGSGSVTTSAYTMLNTSGTLIVKDGAVTINSGATLGNDNGGGDVALLSGALNGYGVLRFDRDLYIGSTTIAPTINITSYNLGTQAKHIYMTPTHPTGTMTIAALNKTEAGTLALDSSVQRINATTFNISSGILQLGAHDQIASRSAGSLTLSGGILDLNNFTADNLHSLNLTRSSSILTGATGGLTFNTAASWSADALLLIQNNGANWLYDGTGAYIRFTSNTVNTYFTANPALLPNIAFGGYETGAKIQYDGSQYYYLLPDAAPTNEWKGSGGPTALWSDPTNWSSGAIPNLSGTSASFRDMDPNLATKTINVNGSYTIARLSIHTSADAFKLGGTGTLAFDGPNAAITHTLGRSVDITTPWRFDTDVTLNAKTSSGAGHINLRNAISGAGNLVLTSVSGAGLRLGGNNAAWSGNFVWQDNNIRLRIENNGTPITGSGTFFIGGTNTAVLNSSTLVIEARAADRTVTLAGGYVLNSHLTTSQNYSDYSQYPSNVYRSLALVGPGILGTGTHTINVDWNNTGSAPSLTLSGGLAGSGGIIKTGGGTLILDSPGDFTGDFIYNGGGLAFRADNALGKGTLYFQANNGGLTFGATGPAVHLDNRIVFKSTIYYTGTIYFDADSSQVGNSVVEGNGALLASGTPLLVFGRDHVIEGTGAFDGHGSQTSPTIRFLGAGNIFTGGVWLPGGAGGSIEIGASSIMESGTVKSGPIGTGTLGTWTGYLRVYSDNPLVTSHTLSNPINIGGGNLNFGLSAAPENTATTLVIDTPALAMRDGRAAMTFNTANGNLRIDTRLTDDGAQAGGFIKQGTGTLTLTHGDNQLTDGVLVTAGVLRAHAATGDIITGIASPGKNHLGSAPAHYANGATAIIEFDAAAGDVYLSGPGASYTLDNNSRIRSTGAGKTYLDSTNTFATATPAAPGTLQTTAGPLVKTGPGTDTTINLRLDTPNLILEAGALTLAAPNLVAGVRNLTFDGGTLVTRALDQTFATTALLNTGASGGWLDMAGDGTIRFADAGAFTSGGYLNIINWTGNIAIGNQYTQLVFTGTAGFTPQVLGNVKFDGYARGAKLIPNGSWWELLPGGTDSEWNGVLGNIWGAGGNWTDGEYPFMPGSQATFGDLDPLLGPGRDITLDQSVALGTIEFKRNTPGDVNIVGTNQITMNGEGTDAAIEQNGASNARIALTGGGYISLLSDLQAAVTNTGTLTLASKISGIDPFGVTHHLVKTGAGALALAADNTFGNYTALAGKTHIAAASILTGATITAGPLGTGTYLNQGDNTLVTTASLILHNPVHIASAADPQPTLTIDTLANSATLAGIISGGGVLAKTGPGALTLTNTASTFSGTLAATQGRTILANDNAAGSAFIQNDSLLTLAFATGTLDNQLGGTGTTHITGSAIRIDAGNTAYSGLWDIAPGAHARINATGNLGAPAARVALDGALTADGSTGITLSNTLAGSGTLIVDLAPAATLTVTASNSYTGGIVLRQGTLLAANTTNATWALGSSTNGILYDTAAGSRLLFNTTSTMSQRQTLAPNASGTLSASSALTVTVAAPITSVGGAAYADTGAAYTLAGDISFTANQATAYGGAIFLGTNALLNFDGGTHAFSQNTARQGGSIFSAYDAVIGGTTAMLRFENNYATEFGAGIYTYRSLTLSGSHGGLVARDNVASQGAAFLTDTDGNLAITGAYGNGGILFASNTAFGGQGGGLFSKGNITIDIIATGDIRMEKNKAATYGGAAWAGDSINLTATAPNLVLAYNSGSAGGVFWTSNQITLGGRFDTLIINSNTATADGGAFRSGGIAITATAAAITVANNTAITGSGGAFHSGGPFTLATAPGATFTATNNKAADNNSGGFLYSTGHMTFDIGAGATATIGDANSIAAAADSLSAPTTATLTKTGAGLLTLWGRNTYAGDTYVNAGRLLLPGYLASAHTYVTGTLAGTGTTGGSVTIRDGGLLAPGASPGFFTINTDLNLQAGSNLHWELGAITNPGHLQHPAVNNLIIVGNDLNIIGTSTLNITPSAPLIIGEYDLIYYGGNLTGDTASLKLGAVAGVTGPDLLKVQIVTSDTHYIKLTYGLNAYSHWDGGDSGLWNNGTSNGGSGTWNPFGADPYYLPWTGTDGNPNGQWADASFAIFNRVSGTVTVNNTAASGTINFSGAQFRTDGYLITSGTLTTAGTASNITLRVDSTHTATIATTITGTHGIDKTDTGTLVLAGPNTYTGATHITHGALVITHTAALGATSATIAPGATLRVATGSIAFSNTLAGSGLFHVDLDSPTSTFTFNTAATAAGFSGTALFNTGAFVLANDALANATARLSAANNTTVATGTQRIHSLALDGGALAFAYTGGTHAAGIIKTGLLDAIAGAVTVTNTNPGPAGLAAQSLLKQDEGFDVLLIDAPAVANTNLTLAGGATTTANIVQGAITTATATYAQTLDYTRGLSVNYTLAQLDLVASRTTTLSGDQSPAPAAELHAKITGAGHLQIDAANAITLNNAANDYTGATTVRTGTLVTGANNALGDTSRLDIRAAAAADIAGTYQKTGYVTTATDSTLALRSGTLAGTNPANAWTLNGLTDARGPATRIDAGNSHLYIGASGTTARLLLDGGLVTTATTIDIGYNTNNAARAEITGSGHLFTPSTLRVGYYGAGTLDLAGTGSASALSAIAGSGPSGNARITLGGTSAMLLSANLILGQSSGAATLAIGDHALVDVTSRSDIGTGNGSGSVTVSGDAWWKNGSLAIGNTGRGALAITGSGGVHSAGSYIGYNHASLSTVTVSDDGYLHLGSLQMAYFAGDQAALTIQDNATVIVNGLDMRLGRARIDLLGGLMQATTITASTSGAHTLTIDSGTLQARAHTGAFISGFTASNTLAIGPGGAFIDTGAYSVGIAADSPLAGPGKLTKLGDGKLTLGASSAYLGGTDIKEGILVMLDTAAIGTGTANIATEAELRVTTAADTLFANSLKGTGLFNIALTASTHAFDFSPLHSYSHFSGTVQLTRATYDLAHNTASETALANATLRTQTGSIINLGTNTASGTMKIHDLELAGGLINVRMKSADAAHILQVDGLKVADAGGVTFNLDTAAMPAGTPVQGNFLMQDSGTNGLQLVKAATLDLPGKQMGILLNGASPVSTGTTLVVGDGFGNTDIEATYNYAAYSNNAAYSGAQPAGPGIYVDYLLTQLKTTTNLVIDNTGSPDTTLSALVSGDGNLAIQAHAASITLSHSNSYTGTTTITSGTLIAAANDALGRTAFLAITNTAALDIGAHTQTIRDGAQIDGTLHGTGSLGLGGLVSITSANAPFAANVGITGTATLHHTSALGDTGTMTLAAASAGILPTSGTLAKTLAGEGRVSLTNTATVAVLGANTAYTGTFSIAPGARLVAETTANLGAANLTGSGVLEKQNAATTITITHANATYTGATLVTGGTLVLADLLGTGTGPVINNAALFLSGTGAYSNNTQGSGTNTITGSVNLTGANTIAAWNIQGSGTVTATGNLGAGDTRIDGLLVARAAGPWVWTNLLTGTGTLSIDLAGNALNFTSHAGSGYLGTLALASSTFHLSGDNTAALTQATLRLDDASRATVATGTQHIGNLTLNGGRLDFGVTIPADISSAALVKTGTLAVTAASGTIGIDLPRLDISTATPQLQLLRQDEGNIGPRLIAADTVTGDLTTLKLVDNSTNAQITNPQTASINQSGTTVATGTYDYGLTSGPANDGLHATYRLEAVDILANRTLTLDQDTASPAGADNFTGKISGSGNLAINANGSITLTNTANTYSGDTLLHTGTLIAGGDNALGCTDRLTLDPSTLLNLDGHSQTIGSLTTAATSTLDLNSGALAIRSGGAIAGHLAGPGALALATGTLHITSANPAYTAHTTIAAPATARITNPAALGAAAIALDGTLVADTPANGTLQNTIAGSGLFLKTNTGTLALATSNPAFHGTATIAAGRLAATQTDSLGDAAITVAAGAAFEQTGLNGALQNALAGAGVHHVTSSTLAITNPAAYSIANTTLNPTALLLLANNNIRFGALQMNNGMLAFMRPNDRATITTLGNTPGLFVMNANLSTLSANHLDITNAGSATHAIHILDNGTQPAVENLAIELVTTANPGSADFVMANPGGKLEYGLTTIELNRGDHSAYTPNPNAWYLTDRNLSHAADAIINTAATQALDWANAMDALHLRMGDLRSENLKSQVSNLKSGNVWLRTRGYRLNASNALSGHSFKQYGWGVTGGADKTFSTQTGQNLLGAFIDMGNADRQFDNAGDGKTRNVGVGVYLTNLRAGGWFLDGIARFDRYSNDFEAKAVNAHTTRAKYTSKAQSLSLEAGRRLQRADGWWLEPGLQTAVLWLNGSSYSTQATASQRALDIRVGDSETWQYRALLRFGRQLRDSRWHPYGKLAAVAVDSSGGEITGHGKTFNTDYDGKRVELGFGTTYRISHDSQLYLDYEYAKAQAYERPWSLNLGYRRLW